MIYTSTGLKEVTIQPLDTSNVNRKYLAICNGRHFEISESVMNLISSLQGCDSIENALNIFSEKQGRIYTPEEFDRLIKNSLTPFFSSKDTSRTKSFWFRRDLFDHSLISRLSIPLKKLFYPRIMFLLIVVGSILELMFFLNFNTNNFFSIDDVSFTILFGLIILLLSSSMFHELGHAAACKFYNVEHGSVGFGLYLIFPVLYTDISNVWTLSRKKRTVVNFSGVYFQLIFLIPLLILYFATGSELLKYCIVVINLNFVFTLNPFFKFDGYWVMSDMLGVPNLRARTHEFFAYLFSNRQQKKQMKKPFLLTMRRVEKISLIVYSILANIFFIYYFVYVIPEFIMSFIGTFPARAEKALLLLSYGQMPDFGTLRSLFIQLLFLGLCIYLIFNLTIKMIRLIKKKVSKTRS